MYAPRPREEEHLDPLGIGGGGEFRFKPRPVGVVLLVCVGAEVELPLRQLQGDPDLAAWTQACRLHPPGDAVVGVGLDRHPL